MAAPQKIKYVAIKPRSGSKYAELSGANVYIGNVDWKGGANKSQYKLCGRVPSIGLKASTRFRIKCPNGGLVGDRIAIHLPKKQVSLVLCEVDVGVVR